MKCLEYLSSREYPGRFIIIGRDQSGENDVVVYGITGRSPASQARKLELESNVIWVKPKNEKELNEGNIDLLIYPAIFLSRGITVSNGKQTEDIFAGIDYSLNPIEVLAYTLHKWDYEPDPPIFTPRISGCILPNKKAALSIIKRADDGSSMRNFFDISLIAGKGKMIATYEGENRDPLPLFSGEPVNIDIKENKAETMAGAVYEALEPRSHKKDFRVAVACVYAKNMSSDEFDTFIINREERVKE